jgi:hypothetical protein
MPIEVCAFQRFRLRWDFRNQMPLRAPACNPVMLV